MPVIRPTPEDHEIVSKVFMLMVKKFLDRPHYEKCYLDDKTTTDAIVVHFGEGRMGKFGRQGYAMYFAPIANGRYVCCINDFGGSPLHIPTKDEPVDLLKTQHTIGTLMDGYSNVEKFMEHMFAKADEMKKIFANTEFKDRLALSIAAGYFRDNLLVDGWQERFFDGKTDPDHYEFGFGKTFELTFNIHQMRIWLFEDFGPNQLGHHPFQINIKEEDYGRIPEWINFEMGKFVLNNPKYRYLFKKPADYIW